MKDINTYFAIVTFLIPGIIIIYLRSIITPINCRSFSKDIFNFLGFSAANYIVYQLLLIILSFVVHECFSPLTLFTILGLTNWTNFLAYIAYILILPVFLGWFICKIDLSGYIKDKLQKYFKTPVDNGILTTWEEIASLEQNAEVEIMLKNGKTIKGVFANNSKISRSSECKDIYISQVYEAYGDTFDTPKSAWINGNEIVSITFQKTELTIINDSKALLYEIIQSIEQFRMDFLTYVKYQEEKERKENNNE